MKYVGLPQLHDSFCSCSFAPRGRNPRTRRLLSCYLFTLWKLLKMIICQNNEVHPDPHPPIKIADCSPAYLTSLSTFPFTARPSRVRNLTVDVVHGVLSWTKPLLVPRHESYGYRISVHSVNHVGQVAEQPFATFNKTMHVTSMLVKELVESLLENMTNSQTVEFRVTSFSNSSNIRMREYASKRFEIPTSEFTFSFNSLGKL